MSTSYREIPLSGKSGAGKVALVDEEDYAYLSQFRWHFKPSPTPGHEGYAQRTQRSGDRRLTVLMHQDIMRAPAGMHADHRRIGTGLDNRRGNLRIVDHATNVRNADLPRSNTSGYRGVTWHKCTRVWRAQIEVHGKKYHLGCFATPEEASTAYEQARVAMGLIAPGGSDAPPTGAAEMPVRPLSRANKSGYRGVTWHKATGMWMAEIKVNRKRHYLGVHATVEAAAMAYEEAALEFGGAE